MSEPQHEHDSPHAAALELAELGWRVMPIAPGKKSPHLAEWQHAATDDHATIDAWWTGLYRDHGVGVRTGWVGDDHLVVLDVDTVDKMGNHGAESLAAMEDAFWPLPPTVEGRTGSGGRHLWFTTDVEIRNSAGRLANTVTGEAYPALDVRGEGGYVVAPPTVHPDGGTYEWVRSPFDHPVAPAPLWLVEVMVAAQRVHDAPREPVDHSGDRPGDVFARSVTWGELLEPLGWTYAGRGHSGEDQWVRPGKTAREGISATTNYRGSDTLKVFTSNAPPLVADETYSKLGFLAAVRHGGDIAAAVTALREAGCGGMTTKEAQAHVSGLLDPATAPQAAPEAPDADGWHIASPEDIAAALDATSEPEMPTVLRRPDGRGLLYAGRVHSLSGEPSSGKTWVAFLAAREVMAEGGHVLHLDWEDNLRTATGRLAALGCDPAVIAERFHYVTPGAAARGGSLPANVVELARRCRLAIVDSVGEAMADVAVKQNDDDAVATWGRRVPRVLAEAGCTVLDIDHVTKDTEGRGRWAIGSQRKMAAIDGAAYTAQVIEPFSREKAGRIKLICAKDRHGTYANFENVGEVTISPNGDRVDVALVGRSDVDEGGRWRPTHLMERVSRFIEEAPDGCSKRSICDGVEGRHQHIRKAIECLIEDGFAELVTSPTGRPTVRCVEPYREPGEEEVVHSLMTPNASARPTASHRVPDAVETHPNPARPRVPPPKGDADALDGGSMPP